MVLLAAGLVLYNNLVNLWPPFHRRAYVPLNLAVAGLVLWAGLATHSARALGLGGDVLAGAAVGAVIALAAVTPLFAAARWAPRRVADARAAGMSGGEVAVRALVRIPLGTALLEEIAFRGVLYAAWRPHGAVAAAVASSVAFGLWHVTPTVLAVRANRPGAAARMQALAALGGVLATAAGGLFLVWMRVRWGSLAATFAFHAGVNSLSTVAAHLAHRRSGPEAG